jgi:FdhE protein
LNSSFFDEKDRIERAFALAGAERPAYANIFPFVEALLVAAAEVRATLSLEIPQIPDETAKARWESGFPLLRRWDFPVDTAAAERLLEKISGAIPADNRQLAEARRIIVRSVPEAPGEKKRFWNSFLHHEMEPWEEWLKADAGKMDLASVLFLARSAVRPCVEFAAEKLTAAHPVPDWWLKGYCPVCGSFPSLLTLEGQGARKGFCSWCATRWNLHRLQCPYCDNRAHESLGYLAVEQEPHNRISYCNLCKFYFRQIDTRELAYPPYLRLEEWTTLHLDLIAQKAGWNQPPSPAPAIYGDGQ